MFSHHLLDGFRDHCDHLWWRFLKLQRLLSHLLEKLLDRYLLYLMTQMWLPCSNIIIETAVVMSIYYRLHAPKPFFSIQESQAPISDINSDLLFGLILGQEVIRLLRLLVKAKLIYSIEWKNHRLNPNHIFATYGTQTVATFPSWVMSVLSIIRMFI